MQPRINYINKIYAVRLIFLIAFLYIYSSTYSQTNVTVTGSNGANTNYVTLGAAFTQINANNQAGRNILVKIIANTTETGTVGITGATGMWNTLTIYPTSAGLSITGNVAGALLDLRAADNVTIDGRVNQSGVRSLRIANGINGSSTIRIVNSAQNNTVQYCTIQGSETDPASGIILFGGGSNNNNTIANCAITMAGTSRPIRAIYSLGTVSNNNITIDSNNIFNVLSLDAASDYIGLSGFTSGWSITNNSFYDTGNASSPYAPAVNGERTIINIDNTAGSFTISGNFLGGRGPSCSNVWVKDSGFGTTFTAIKLNVGSASVQGNTIQNINWNYSGANTGGAWTAFDVIAGNVNIGTVTGNTIGDQTTSAASAPSITASTSSTGGTPLVVYCLNGVTQAGTTINFKNNTVGSIAATNNISTNNVDVYLINCSGPGSIDIANNILGSTTTANSIYSSSQSTGVSQNVRIISCNSTGTNNVSNNTIANITNNGRSNSSSLDRAIICTNGTATISNNTIYNFLTRTQNPSMFGIVLWGNPTVSQVYGNTVHNLSCSSTTAGGKISGIAVLMSITSAVYGNFVYNLSGASSSTSIYGLNIAGDDPTPLIHPTNLNNVYNNIVKLTVGDSPVYGIFETTFVPNNTNNIYFNTVYINGAPTSGTINSYAFQSGSNANTRNIRNNIFSNYCSNGGTATGKHYAAFFKYGVATGLTLNYNDYYAPNTGTGGVLGFYNSLPIATLAALRAAIGQNANSYNINPTFVNGGSAISTDYKIGVDLAGVAGTGITTDFGNNARAVTPTMGAWERSSMTNKWRGVTSTAWNTTSNWTLNVIPTADANIVFDYDPQNHCLLDQNRSVTDITNDQSTYRMVTNGFNLRVKGNFYFTNGAQIDASDNSSTVEFAGASAQTIPAGTFYNNKVYNLTINNSNNVSLSGTLNLLNLLTPASGLLDATTNSPTVIYGGTTAQTIESNSYTSDGIYNLTSDNAAGVTVNASPLTVGDTLTIISGKLLNIAEQKQLTAPGTIINNAGTSGFVIKSSSTGTGSLLHNTDNVPATVNRYINGTASDWHFLSAPVTNQDISGSWKPAGTYGDGTGYDLYVWNEPNSCWIYNLNTTVAPTWATVHPQSNFVSGRGYLYAVQAATPTKQFIGNLGNGAVTYALTTDATTVNKGFNLIGNPYPSSIDWKVDAGYTRNMLFVNGSGNDIWTWSDTANNYGIYNSADPTDMGTNNVSRYIAPMQGFFVRANSSGSFGFNNAARIHNGASAWMKAANLNYSRNSFLLTVISEDGKGSDEVKLNFGFEHNENGALKMFSSVKTAPSLYLPVPNQLLSIIYLTDTIENKTVPVDFKAGINGKYTLKYTADQSKIDQVYLEDKLTNTFYDFSASTQYAFTATTDDAASRFILHFGKVMQKDNTINANVYIASGSIIVDLTGLEGDYRVQITDILGRNLAVIPLTGGQTTRYRLNVRGVYIITLYSATTKTSFKKIY